MTSGLTQKELKGEIRRAVANGYADLAELLFAEWERMYSPRAKAARALRELDVALGQAFLSIPGMRWLFTKLGLKPKAKYEEEAG